MCINRFNHSPSAPRGLRDFKFKVHALVEILLSKVEKYQYSPITENESVSPNTNHIGGVI